MYRCVLIFIFLGLNPLLVRAQAKEEPIMLRTKDCNIQGTLLLPGGGSNTVVLIVAGSGPMDRDGNQTLMRSNAYRMYATALASHNLASVRYDKRGLPASRGKDYDQSTISVSSYIEDVKEWVEMLHNDPRFKNVIIAGHSEGSLIGLAAVAEGCSADGLILISGMGRYANIVLKEQLSEQPRQVRDIAFAIIDSLHVGRMVDNVPLFLRNIFAPSVQPYLISIFGYNPEDLIRSINIPILIMQGETDIQLKAADAKILKAANPKARVRIITGMNHIMKVCPTLDRTSQHDTYVNPAYPLSPIAIDESVKFIGSIQQSSLKQ